MNDFTICPNCDYKIIGKNIYGKICNNCGTFIEPIENPPIMLKIEENKKKIKEDIINYIERKNAN